MFDALQIAGWVVAGILGVINIVIVLIIIPTRTKVNQLSDDLHIFQTDNATAQGDNKSEAYHNREDINRHEKLIESMKDCTAGIQARLTGLETATATNTKLLQELNEKLYKLLFNGRKTSK